MELETMTMHEKLLVVRRMIERGELLVSIGCGARDDHFDELAASFNSDKNRIIIEI